MYGESESFVRDGVEALSWGEKDVIGDRVQAPPEQGVSESRAGEEVVTQPNVVSKFVVGD